eukprot:gene14970-biopygen110
MSAILKRAMPDAGVLAFLQVKGAPVQAALRTGQLPTRHAGYIRAFQQAGLHRRTQHQDMLKQQDMLLQGTQAQLMFNKGQLTRTIAIDAGCAQGSPLSPLLYVIAAQPLAARCRQLQLAAGFNAILLPEGRPAPCSHQHADDTTLHAADIASVRVLLQQAVEPFCRATGGKLNITKSKGMVMGSHPPVSGVEQTTGVTFVNTTVEHIRHLGILLSTSGVDAFADRIYGQRLQLIAWRVKL